MSGTIPAHSAILRSLEGKPTNSVRLRICRAVEVNLHKAWMAKPYTDLRAIPWTFKERIIREPRGLPGVRWGCQEGRQL